MEVAQLCPTVCDPMDYTVHEMLQARLLVCVAFPLSRDLPNPGIEPRSLELEAGALTSKPPGKQKTLIQFLGQEDLLEKG